MALEQAMLYFCPFYIGPFLHWPGPLCPGLIFGPLGPTLAHFWRGGQFGPSVADFGPNLGWRPIWAQSGRLWPTSG